MSISCNSNPCCRSTSDGNFSISTTDSFLSDIGSDRASPPTSLEDASNPATPRNAEPRAEPRTQFRHSYQDNSAFFCSHPECPNVNFKNEKDLNRHKKMHDPDAPLWKCGCCQNLGNRFEKKRKDKIRDHLRMKHKQPKAATLNRIASFPGVRCPLVSCHTLLTTSSCLEEHLRQAHPGYIGESGVQTNSGSTCICSVVAKHEMQEATLQHSKSIKHRAVSPVQPNAKRLKQGTVASQPSESAEVASPEVSDLQSQNLVRKVSSDGHVAAVCATNLIADQGSTAQLTIPSPNLNINSFPNQESEIQNEYWYTDELDRSSVIYPSDPFNLNASLSYLNGADMNHSLSVYNSIDPSVMTDHSINSTQRVEVRSQPSDFLAIQDREDFLQLKAILETENPHSSPITYNPQKNIIALTSNATGMLGKAQRVLQNLVDDFSSDLGSQYLIAFDKDEWPSTERQITSTSNTQNGGRGERSKMYEIRPKDDTRLVIIWLKFILPNLSQILEPRIGRTYTASLVRLGRSELDANPCIQIECPFIPDQAGQESIMNILTTIYKANSYHQAISIRFFQGHVRMLNGGDDDNGDAASTNNLEAQRVRFSFNRPFSKLRMGASLGLLCSTKVSGTLGGFVFIEGKTYILTSQHFVTRSQDSVSPRRLAVDENAVDDKILTSPSVSDLYLMENSLKQKLRDSRGKINDLMTGTYGDQYISSSFLSDLTCLPEPLKEARQWQEQVKSLLKQVRRPPDKYEVGRIFRQRTEATRSAFYPRPLAHSLGLSNDSLIHTMDWCLCKSNNENAENRHKYRSTLAAKIDAYIEEADHNDQPGELCHDICEVEPAVAVYYVGQGSGRRDGRVNGALVATSCGSSASQEWSIISSDAQWLDYNDVQGDSGAWVIRQRDNKLMGQVHGHASGQVLFTPIKVIFDDMRSQFGANVSLPPSPLAPALAPIQIQSMPLCGVRDENDPNPYSQITSTPPSLETLKPHFVTHEPEETKHQEINNGEVENREANKFFRQRDDSFSSLPSLTEASLSSSSKSPNQSDEETGVDEIQPTNFDSLSGKHANANIRPLIADSETRDYTKHLITKFSEMKHAISLRISRSGRVTTWPIYTKGNIGKPRLEGRWMRKLKRGGDKGFDDNAGRLPRSEGAVGTNIDISLRQLQRSLTVFPWNPRFQAEPETSEARSFRILYTI